MPYNIFFPFVIKRHGCIRYCKNVLLAKHQFSTGPKKISSQKAKIVAAAAATPSPQAVSNLANEPFPHRTSCKNSISDSANSLILSTAVKELSESCDAVDSHPTHSEIYESPALFCKKSNHYVTVDAALSQDDLTGGLGAGFKKISTTHFEVLNANIVPSEIEKQMNPPTITLVDAIKPSETEWQEQILKLKLLPRHYMSLSKIRLTGLVVITTVAGYGMSSAPLDPLTLLFTVVGTGLTSAAANSINQFLEVPYDSQMSRTKNRVLVRGILTPLHAFTFAVCSGTLGLATLYLGANGLTAALGATNLILYTSVYTPLKRCSIINTWVGSVVGAIPPVMGWAACSGSLSSSAILLGAILYSWQFPHFNALSWNLRPDYSRAGYRMMSVINPLLCRKTALRHSIAILFFCTMAPIVDLTTWTFAVDSLPLNCYFIYCAWQFYKNPDSKSSRKLFRLSLIHLPVLMLLMFVGKKHPQEDNKKKEDYL